MKVLRTCTLYVCGTTNIASDQPNRIQNPAYIRTDTDINVPTWNIPLTCYTSYNQAIDLIKGVRLS